MQLKLWNFSKRLNSTKRPNDADARTFQINLKNMTSVENPTFLLSGNVADLMEYNYAYWNKHYYFVQDVRLNYQNLVEITCMQDDLATHKNTIGNYRAFIERASSEYDAMLPDNYISRSYRVKKTGYSGTPIPNWNASGCYVVRICGGNNSSSSSGVSTYAMSKSRFKEIMDFMFNSNNFPELADETVKTFFNPFQYILDVRWYPFLQTFASSEESTDVSIGWWNTGKKAIPVQTNGKTFDFDINIPEAYYSDWRKHDPSFTRYSIFVPGIGNLSLSNTDLMDGVKGKYDIDFVTGDALFHLVNSHGGTISTYQAQLGIPIQIGQLNGTLGTAFTAMMGTVEKAQPYGVMSADYMTGTFAGRDFGAVTTQINNVSAFTSPTPSVNGSQASIAILAKNSDITVSVICFESKDYATQTSGRPLCENRLISSLSGFVKCAGANVPLDSLSGDKQRVNALLNGGFYYE